VCVWERESLYVSKRERVRGPQSSDGSEGRVRVCVCMSACVCVREKERESVCVRTCV